MRAARARAGGRRRASSSRPRCTRSSTPSRCIGCGACAQACPEQPEHHVLGLIGGKAQLVSPTDCIGHGACRAACPVDAITLVFGTERAASTSPCCSAEFETNVPGIYHRRRARRHGPDPQCADAGPAGGRGDHGSAQRRRRGTRRADRRRRPGRVRRRADGAVARTALSSTIEQEIARRLRVPVPARQDRDDRAGRAAADRQDPASARPRRRSCSQFWQDIERKTGVPARCATTSASRASTATGAGLHRAHVARRVPSSERAARDRPARHAAQARRAGRGAAEGGLPADRPRAVPRAARAGRRRRRQRAGGRGQRRRGRRRT